jgi:carbon storage regulator
VLSRKKGQSIVVNDDIEIVVVDVQRDSVRVGIKAPKDVSIYRREIYEEIVQENQLASGTKKIAFEDVLHGLKKEP